MLQGVPFPLVRYCRTGHQQWTQQVTGARAITSKRCQGHRMSRAVPLGAALPSWSALKTDPSFKLSLFKTVVSKWRQPCSQQGRSHVLLGGKPGSRGLRFCSWHALSNFTTHCYSDLQRNSAAQAPAQLPAAAGVSEGGRSCCAPFSPTAPLLPLPLLTLRHFSVSFLINNVIYH